MKINGKYAAYLSARRGAGETSFAFRGSRRSGKTYFISQFLVTRAYSGEVVNVASMTQSQGRLGAYSDFVNIIQGEQALKKVFECLQSPLEIRNRFNEGKVIFNSYQKGFTAKGIACDWLFVNEANAFDKLQVANLRANVRKGWIIDYNPDTSFWDEEYFADNDICNCFWQDNPFLTNAQKEWFYELKRNAEKPTASSLDKWLYRVYYLGEYAERGGSIFTGDNIHFGDVPERLMHYTIFTDPSALRGSDYFAMVLVGTDGRNMYVVDVWSRNNGSNADVFDVIERWRGAYNVERIWVETNGIIGVTFFEEARKNGIPVQGWFSRGDKFDRITANYQDLTTRVVFANTAECRLFVEQVYSFERNCEHDDNIDAVNSALMYYRNCRLM